MYNCQTAEPGRLPEPYHLPGYSGHVPSMTARYGGTFGRLSRDAMEDPCVAQAPIPVLQPPQCPCPSPSRSPQNYGGGGNFGGPMPAMQLQARMCPSPCAPSYGGGNSFQAQAPQMQMRASPCPSPTPQFYCRNPMGCEDLGCCSPALCAVPRPPPMKKSCTPPPLPCLPECCDPRAHHLNRSPFACPCKPEPNSDIYRCCEPMGSSYAGHVPGFTFHSNGRTFGNATWGTKQYMQNCFYFNTFAK